MSPITNLFSKPEIKERINPTPAPSTNAAPDGPDPEKLRRMGRASLLINTSAGGVLGNAQTGRKQLLSAT